MNARLSIIALVLGAAATGVASAEAPTKSFSLHAFGSYQRYDMADVNEAMRTTLAAFPGSTAEKDEIDSGAGFGAGLRIWPRPRLFFSLEAQRLLASNSGSGPYLGSTYAVDLNVPATSITLGLGYVFFERERLRLALSGGGGYYVCSDKLDVSGPGLDAHTDLEGSGFGFHGMGHVLARLASRLDLEVGGGYRRAKTTDVTSDGARIRNSDGSLATIDWSGVMARAGLSFRVSGE